MSSTSSRFRQAVGSSTLPTAQLLLLIFQRKNDDEKGDINPSSESRDLYCYPLRSGQDSCRRAVSIVVAEQVNDRTVEQSRKSICGTTLHKLRAVCIVKMPRFFLRRQSAKVWIECPLERRLHRRQEKDRARQGPSPFELHEWPKF